MAKTKKDRKIHNELKGLSGVRHRKKGKGTKKVDRGVFG